MNDKRVSEVPAKADASPRLRFRFVSKKEPARKEKEADAYVAAVPADKVT